jgi:hypothetical protein
MAVFNPAAPIALSQFAPVPAPVAFCLTNFAPTTSVGRGEGVPVDNRGPSVPAVQIGGVWAAAGWANPGQKNSINRQITKPPYSQRFILCGVAWGVKIFITKKLL